MLQRDTIYVGGAWSAPSSLETIDVVDPATEHVVATVPMCSPEDASRAVRAARSAFVGWSSTTPAERAEKLADLRDVLADRADELTEIIVTELGAPRRFVEQTHVGLPLRVLSSYVELLAWYSFEVRAGSSMVIREPAGVVAAMTPWNLPLHQIVVKTAAALAAGCTLVVKPSQLTPLTAYSFAEIVHEAGLPPGVFNLVPGTGDVVGETLIGHPDVDVVSFTGSTDVGLRVCQAAARTMKRTVLELPGAGATVILPDADHRRAMRAAVGRALSNSGQACTSLPRVLIHRSHYDEAIGLAKESIEPYRVGNPNEESVRVGPLITAASRDRVRALIESAQEAGARLIAGGPDEPTGLASGYFVQPTVLADVTASMDMAAAEVFGPVVMLMPYSDEEEAVAFANRPEFGLAGAVWSADAARAVAFARRMRCGQVDINEGRFNPRAPFGGYGRSGLGRELGVLGMEEYTEVKSLQM